MKRVVTEEELARQRAYMDEVRELNRQRATPPLAFVDTYGCQQNEADSEKLRGMLREMGYAMTEEEAAADVILINTCAVREHAQQRVLGNVGALIHAKRAHPGQILGVCGCMVQQPSAAATLKQSYQHVDLVFGPHELYRFPELLLRRLQVKKRIFLAEPCDGVLAEGLPTLRKEGVRAWLPIMQGCNNFCTYCVVPYVRGREMSRAPEAVLAEAEELIREGKKEITLLGQNVNSYGAGTGTDFPALLEAAAKLEGEFILRFMTSHPKDASEQLFRVMASSEKVARHIHLPFQSGSNRVLRAMNRHYTRERYLELVALLRSYVPDVTITSDVIVGFPGETEEEFEETMTLVEEVGFDSLFIFIYSPRVGTPAAELPDPASHGEKVARLKRLTALQDRVSLQKMESYVGRRLRVLVDGRDDSGELYTARTSGNVLVHLRAPEGLVGRFVTAEIEKAESWRLLAKASE